MHQLLPHLALNDQINKLFYYLKQENEPGQFL